MKKGLMAVLLLGTLSTQASLVYFDISPPGTDAAVGLSPSNQVPAVTNSTGSGGEISAGVVFDTDTMVLQVAIGYGAAAGFSNLTGVPVAMHIHGPAAAGQNASPVINLSPYNFPSADATQGGVIYGNITVAPDIVSNLLAGLTYVNIHTALNPGGEIRGQLVPEIVSNSSPVVTCPPDSTVQCGSNAVLTAQVSDPDGDALTVTWSVNGAPVQTNSVPAQNPPVAFPVTLTTLLPLGTNVVTVAATDTATNTSSCSSVITVVDTIPPVIVSAWAKPNVLWPPNHKMVMVKLSAVVTDACGPTSWKVVKVTSNEPVNSKGDGNTSPDWIISGPTTVALRAERAGNGNGRIYCVTLQAKDEAGNVSSNAVVKVRVPHDQGR